MDPNALFVSHFSNVGLDIVAPRHKCASLCLGNPALDYIFVYDYYKQCVPVSLVRIQQFFY